MAKTATETKLEAKDPVVLDTSKIWHGILYGDAGVGKSHTFSTFAHKDRPICVWHFDGLGKDRPYHLRDRGGVVQPDELTDKWGTRYREVKDTNGNLLVRIEYYHDPAYDAPEAFGRFRERVNYAAREFEKGKIWGFFLDTVTSLSLAARKYDEFVENSSARDPRKWFGAEADQLENLFILHLPRLPSTVGIGMHVSKTKIETEGSMVRAPWVRGRNFEQLSAQWPEIYRVYVDKTAEKKLRRMQTENDEKWLATTVLGVEDGAIARWSSIEKAF